MQWLLMVASTTCNSARLILTSGPKPGQSWKGSGIASDLVKVTAQAVGILVHPRTLTCVPVYLCWIHRRSELFRFP